MNAIKHAFNQPGGAIAMSLKLANKQPVLLTLSDNGKGAAPEFNIDRAITLGMEIMKA